MRIGFYQPHLDERGTGVAYFEYAYFNQKILGNESFMFYDENDHRTHPCAKLKFEKEINTIAIKGRENMTLLEEELRKYKIDALYIQKCGKKNDGRFVNNTPMLIHVVGCNDDPHGISYAYTSRWLSEEWSKSGHPYIPYIVRLPEHKNNLRERLKISNDSFVFGILGGSDSFNISYAQECVKECLNSRKEAFFLFANIPPFLNHPRAIFIDAFSDLNAKRTFINSCDVMLHCRHGGETFGMAIAEFSYCNKPVITWLGSPEKAHIDHLGNKGIYYNNREELQNILNNFKVDKSIDYNVFKEEYSPEEVMQKFKKIFLDKI